MKLILVVLSILLIVSVSYASELEIQEQEESNVVCDFGYYACGQRCYKPPQTCTNGVICDFGYYACGQRCYKPPQTCNNGVICDFGYYVCGQRHDHLVVIDEKSVQLLCEKVTHDEELLRLICEKKLVELTSKIDIIREAAINNNLLALRVFTEFQRLHPKKFIIQTDKLAMDDAIARGHRESVQFLLENRSEGLTMELAILNACSSNNRSNMLRYLLVDSGLDLGIVMGDKKRKKTNSKAKYQVEKKKNSVHESEKPMVSNVLKLDADLIDILERNNFINYFGIASLFSDPLVEFSPFDPKVYQHIQTYFRLFTHKQVYNQLFGKEFKKLVDRKKVLNTEERKELLHIFVNGIISGKHSPFHKAVLFKLQLEEAMDDQARMKNVFKNFVETNYPDKARNPPVQSLMELSVQIVNPNLFKMVLDLVDSGLVTETLNRIRSFQVILPSNTPTSVILEFFDSLYQLSKKRKNLLDLQLIYQVLDCFVQNGSPIEIIDQVVEKIVELIKMSTFYSSPRLIHSNTLILALRKGSDKVLDLFFHKYRDYFRWTDINIKDYQTDKEEVNNNNDSPKKQWSAQQYIQIFNDNHPHRFILSQANRAEHGILVDFIKGNLHSFDKHLLNPSIGIPKHILDGRIWSFFHYHPDFEQFQKLLGHSNPNSVIVIFTSLLLETLAIQSTRDSEIDQFLKSFFERYYDNFWDVHDTCALNGLVNLLKYVMVNFKHKYSATRPKTLESQLRLNLMQFKRLIRHNHFTAFTYLYFKGLIPMDLESIKRMNGKHNKAYQKKSKNQFNEEPEEKPIQLLTRRELIHKFQKTVKKSNGGKLPRSLMNNGKDKDSNDKEEKNQGVGAKRK
eukprot:gene2628-3260_t